MTACTKIKKVKLKKIGNSHFILIPADYINHGELSYDKVYNLIIEEVNDPSPPSTSKNSTGEPPPTINEISPDFRTRKKLELNSEADGDDFDDIEPIKEVDEDG